MHTCVCIWNAHKTVSAVLPTHNVAYTWYLIQSGRRFSFFPPLYSVVCFKLTQTNIVSDSSTHHCRRQKQQQLGHNKNNKKNKNNTSKEEQSNSNKALDNYRLNDSHSQQIYLHFSCLSGTGFAPTPPTSLYSPSLPLLKLVLYNIADFYTLLIINTLNLLLFHYY